MQKSISAKLKPTAIFNPKGDDGNRQIWFGNTTNLMQLNDLKYFWALGLWKQMRQNFWVAEKVDMTQDVTCYKELTASEKRAYDGILSYLTFLDSLQTCNLPHIRSPITAPEITLCLAEQASQEALHNQSYQVLIEAIIPSDRRNQIYELWREDKILAERCDYIAKLYQKYLTTKTQEDYFYVLIANYLLEGIYFYNGFVFFFNLSSRMLMNASADMIAYIKRDELSHVRLFQKLIPEAMKVFPYSKDKIYEMFSIAVEQEKRWTSHIIGNEILGITEDSIDRYTKYLANLRLDVIGLEPLYHEDKYQINVYKHLENTSDTSKEGNTKSNFFEATVTGYNISSALEGWEDF